MINSLQNSVSMKNKNIILLVLIIVLSFFVRTWKVSSVPPGLGNDEISIAYDAYSLINTGRDSTGAYLPLSFKSHDNYKAPLYAYLAAPVIKVLGNNEFAVRFPSILFGTLTVLGIYFLIKELTSNNKWAFLGAFLLAITPWHVYTSRIALESNLALCLVTFGTYFFLKGIKSPKYLSLSAFVFSLSLYTYQTEMIFTPLLLITLSLIYFKKIKTKNIITLWAIFLGLLIPFFINIFFFRGENRAANVFLLNDFILQGKLSGVVNPFLKIFIVASFVLDKFLQYLGLGYNFGHGLPVASPFGSSDFGLFNFIQLPFFIIGSYLFITYKDKVVKWVILSWFLAGPLISTLTLGELNLVRNLVSIIPWTIISAFGFVVILNKFKSKGFLALAISLFILNFLFYYRHYIKYFPIQHSQEWSYGFKQIAQYVHENENRYQKIIIDYHYGVDQKLFGAPSLFILYFNHIDPQKYLTESKNEGFLTFGKYEFRFVDWPKEITQKGSLYIVGVTSNPLKKNAVKEIYSINLLDGQKAFQFFETEKQ